MRYRNRRKADGGRSLTDIWGKYRGAAETGESLCSKCLQDPEEDCEVLD